MALRFEIYWDRDVQRMVGEMSTTCRSDVQVKRLSAPLPSFWCRWREKVHQIQLHQLSDGGGSKTAMCPLLYAMD